MNRVRRMFKNKGGVIRFPVEGRSHFFVNEGDEIKKGDLVYKTEFSRVLESHNIVAELEIKINEIDEFLLRIDGEMIEEGDVLAEKVTKAGLAVKQVLAGHDGVISLKRVNKGYLDLLSEKRKSEVKSNFNGRIVRESFQYGLDIETNYISYEMFDHKFELPVGFADKVEDLSLIHI